ncbi:RNA methyltransferase [Brumimicrobium aurantiacum]|uniref:RNA methyltransferase n=1 Tax=Brumimicrobium aurantiacum TaxID=1737063 RepID=A0A3E1EYC3_9FLAO|nr:RNA methyltransferase [Brumimicrobium aurantiacum]RFC54561.1 RNA methyltransferase [Brumimicrobium aurantiacum]
MISKQQIKYIRSLHKKKFRDLNAQFTIEGPKMISEAIQHAPDCLMNIYGIENEFKALPEHVSFVEIDQKSLGQISTLKHPQKQVAICSYLPTSQEESEFYIALDTIQDPGNLGTILRLAAWFGVEKIIASKETVDCYNPKVVQASMGAIFNVSIEYTDLKEVFEKTDLPIYGSLLEGENIYQKKIEKKGILVMGNEGNGIQDSLLPLITEPVTIPKFGKGESLNVAMATSVFLSEFARR